MAVFTKIGLGSVQFGLPYGINNQNGQTPPHEVAAVLDVAFEKGITLLDTASGYGTAEAVLGKTHQHRFDIVSKFMPPEKGATIEQQLHQSLQLLQTNHLYGYLAHRPLAMVANPENWQELQELKALQKIKKIGFSFNDPSEYEPLKLLGFLPDLVQVPFNYFDHRFIPLMEELKAAGCEIHTRSTYLQGLFFKPTNELPSFFAELKGELLALQTTYGEVLQDALLHYVLSFDFVDKVLVGVETKQQLERNLEHLDKAPELPTRSITYTEQLLMPSNWPKE